MAFLKGVKSAIEVPVKIMVPALNEKDEEVVIEVNPIVQFKRFKRTEARKVQLEVAKISREAAEAFESGDMTALFTDRLDYFDDLLRDSIVGWRKMPGPDDEEVPFSAEILEEAIEDNHYYAGLMAGMRKALGWESGETQGSEVEEQKN